MQICVLLKNGDNAKRIINNAKRIIKKDSK